MRKKNLITLTSKRGSFAAHFYFEMGSYHAKLIPQQAMLFSLFVIYRIFIRRRALQIRHATDKCKQNIEIAKRDVFRGPRNARPVFTIDTM